MPTHRSTTLGGLGVLPQLHLLGKACACMDQSIHNACHREHPSDDSACCRDEMIPAEMYQGEMLRQRQFPCQHLPAYEPLLHRVLLMQLRERQGSSKQT